MAMNRQRRTSNISNIFSYDDAGNIVIKDYSQVIRYSWNGTIHGFVGQLSVSSVSAAVTDTDKFLVSDGGVLKFRTGAEVLSDIGAFILPSFTSGSVLFSNGTSIAQDNANFFWDDANNRLGIGTNAPSTTLDIRGKTRIQSSGNAELDIIDGANQLRLAMGSSQGFVGTLTSHPFGFFTAASKRGEFSTNGNFILQNGGTFSDNGNRLQVYGDAYIKGSGATSATTGLTVQDSAGLSMFRVRNDNRVFVNQLGFGNDYPEIFPTTSGAYDINGGSLIFRSSQAATYGNYSFYFRHVYTNVLANASGTSGGININIGLSVSSGTGIHNTIALQPIINQTGGANGITRGLYIAPTLNAAADWRSIEWSNNTGWGLYGAGTANNYLGGSLGIGTTSPAYALDVRATTGFIAASFKSQYTAVGYLGGDNTAAWIGTGADGLVNAVLIGTTINTVAFYCNSNERGRIHTTGNWSIANSIDSGYKFDVNGPIRSTSGGILFSSTGANNDAFYTLLSSNIRFYVSANGNLKAISSYITDTNGAPTTNASAIAQIDSTTKGFLAPRMTTTEKNAIATPATGLQVYDTTLGSLNVYNGTAWVALGAGGGGGSNIYTADGTLSGDRTITSNGNSLTVLGGKEEVSGFPSEQISLRLQGSTTAKNPYLSLKNTNANGKDYALRSLVDGAFEIFNYTNLSLVLKHDWTNNLFTFRASTTLTNNGFYLGENTVSGLWLNGTRTIGNYAICHSAGDTFLNAPTGGRIGFRVGNSDRMTLTNAGRLLLGTTSESTFLLDVNGTARVSNTLSVITTATTNDVALFKSAEPYITIEAAGASNSASIFLKPSTSAQNATIQNRTGGGLDFYTGATPSLSATIKSTGAVVVSSTLGLNGVEDSVKSGKYTPTLTNGTNVASSAVNTNTFKYVRVGNVVNVSGWLSLSATSANTLTELEISLPIASNITSDEDVSGVANTLSAGYGQIRENATNNTAKMYIQPTSTSNLVWYMEFSYVII